MKNKLFKLLYILLSLNFLLLSSCADADNEATYAEESDLHISDAHMCCPEEVPDMGEEYIESFIFFGESTTSHMRSREVLSGGKGTTQVWSTKSGTSTLDMQCDTLRIVYPETGEELTIREAVKRKQPKIIVLTFGLNGAVTKIKHGEGYFRTCYMKLIGEIRAGSPSTKIVLQSCFPISNDMDMHNYTVDAETLKSYIEKINAWTHTLASDAGLTFFDTFPLLCGEDGYLADECNAGDGYHLTADAYVRVLEYMRTHKIKE